MREGRLGVTKGLTPTNMVCLRGHEPGSIKSLCFTLNILSATMPCYTIFNERNFINLKKFVSEVITETQAEVLF